MFLNMSELPPIVLTASRPLEFTKQPRIEMVDYAAWRLRLSAENRGTALGRPLEESNW